MGYQLQEKFFHRKWPVEISVDVSVRVQAGPRTGWSAYRLVRVQAGSGGNTFQNVYKNKVTSQLRIEHLFSTSWTKSSCKMDGHFFLLCKFKNLTLTVTKKFHLTHLTCQSPIFCLCVNDPLTWQLIGNAQLQCVLHHFLSSIQTVSI